MLGEEESVLGEGGDTKFTKMTKHTLLPHSLLQSVAVV